MSDVKVNCVFLVEGRRCTCAAIEKSLFGIGPRLCLEQDGKKCEHKKPHEKN